MKEFQTAVRSAEDREAGDEEKFEFKVDAKTFTAYKPTSAQTAVVLSKVGRHATIATKIAGIIDFFMGIMDADDAGYLAERLLDRNDDFGIAQVESILAWLIEEWGAHPTQEPSGSSSSQSATGPSSTPTSGEPNHSTSPSIAS